MRDKEIEEAIKYCNLLLAGDITVHIRNEYGETEYAGDVDKQYNEDLKTVLSYIETLEELPNKIRDKIKELEDRAKEYGYYKTEIEYARNTLQEIIGE